MPPSPTEPAGPSGETVAAAAAPIEAARAHVDAGRIDLAQDTLRAALEADPGQPSLWRMLAELLCIQARHAEAIVFFEEALRLDPACASALDGIAEALLLVGDVERALDASAEAVAVATADDAPSLLAAHARRLLAAGRLQEGWTTFAGAFPGEAEVRAAAPPWTPGQPLTGRLLLFGETDMASEVLLAQTLPDLIARGPPPILAVDPRWVSLAERSFPGAVVVDRLARAEGSLRLQAADLDSPHVHRGELVGAWAPLRAAMPDLRSRLTDFAGGEAYLTPEPARVAHWRELLAGLGPGPKIGVLWRPSSDAPTRAWEALPLAALAEPLSRPTLQLISLQEEESPGELAWIRETCGLAIHGTPPLYRSWDFDDLAALAVALDVVIGIPDAASYAAAACGAETWFLAPPHHWALLGAETYPWFPAARVFSATAPGDWSGATVTLDQALGELAAGKPGPPLIGH